MIIVTGAAGFIGSNLIQGLNAAGYQNILAVDDLTNGHKFSNLIAGNCADYQDFEDFLENIKADAPFAEPIQAVLHCGACSATTEWNGRYMMRNNYEYSKYLLHYCLTKKIPFIYASSAAVYGAHREFDDRKLTQHPLNVYGYSKWLFDCYVRRLLPSSESLVVGLRYFNVYGPFEQHKGPMASVAYHFMSQLNMGDEVKLFAGSGDFADGEQLRDFIYIDDVVKINLWFLKQLEKSGIYNVGTGQARSFNDLAKTLLRLKGRGNIHYIPFPEHLKGAYQNFTQADISSLRQMGYNEIFMTLEDGLSKYYNWHNSHCASIRME